MRISLSTAIFCPTCDCVTDNATTCDCGATLNLTPMAGWMERKPVGSIIANWKGWETLRIAEDVK